MSIRKIMFVSIALILHLISLSYAGELRQKPFKNVYGNERYEYEDDDYKADISSKPFKNVYGQNEYEVKDNQGNVTTVRKKPFPDVYGNPVYDFSHQGPLQDNEQNASQQRGTFQDMSGTGLSPTGSADSVANGVSNGVAGFIEGFQKGMRARGGVSSPALDLESDAKIDLNYSFQNTKVALTYHSEIQKIAVKYLVPLLEKKGWTIIGDKNAEYDLISGPLFKEHDNFQGAGYNYLTMNLYFFRNAKTGNTEPVIDAFVMKRITSNNIEREVKTMCYEIIKRIPTVRDGEANNKYKKELDLIEDEKVSSKDPEQEKRERISGKIKRNEGLTDEEMGFLEKDAKASQNLKLQMFELEAKNVIEARLLKGEDMPMYDDVMKLGPVIIEGNKEYSEKIHNAFDKGENIMLLTYDLIRNDPKFKTLYKFNLENNKNAENIFGEKSKK